MRRVSPFDARGYYYHYRAGASVAALGSGGFSPFSVAIFEAFTTPPTNARKTAIDDCVKALVAGGVWDKLDVLYMLAAADSQAALVNWVNPGTYDGTLVNSPTFTADEGFTGNGSSTLITTGFNPTSAPSPKFIQDSASLFARSLALGGDDFYAGYTTGSTLSLWPSLIIRMNAASGFSASVATAGLHQGVRENATDVKAYRNGAANGTSTEASVAVVNSNTSVLGGNGQFSGAQLASYGIGASMSAAEAAALAAAELAYMQAVGAV